MTYYYFLTYLKTLAQALMLERKVAIDAVTRASSICRQVFKQLVNADTIVKNDRSPVTGKFVIIIS